MIYIIKQAGLYQNKVNSSLISNCNCKMGYWTMHKPFISPGAPNDFLAIIEQVWVGYEELCKII